MDKIEWSDDWTLDHAEIDEQHKTLVGILNQLISRDATVNKTINELIEYAAIHFADEENFMVNAAYPEFDLHRKEHKDFTKTLLDLSFQITTVEGGPPEEMEQLIEILEKFVSVWFTGHFLGTDRDFIDYLEGGGK